MLRACAAGRRRNGVNYVLTSIVVLMLALFVALIATGMAQEIANGTAGVLIGWIDSVGIS